MATIEQLPGAANISMMQGDDLSLQFSVEDNLSGYTFVATIEPLNGGSVTCSTALIPASTSTVTVEFPATTTSALALTGKDGPHAWRLVYTDPSSNIRTWVSGTLTVNS